MIVHPDTSGDTVQALQFLQTVFRGEQGGALVLSMIHRSGKVISGWGHDPRDGVAEILTRHNLRAFNIYAQVSTHDWRRRLAIHQRVENARAAKVGRAPRTLGPEDLQRVRGTIDTALELPGFWGDFDIAGPAHTSGNLPPNREAVMELLAECPLRPTILVDSGHGLQPWWLFHQPLYLHDDALREKANLLSQRWQLWWRQRAAGRGWTFDATHDLARLLRLPGTYNRKKDCDPVMVRIVEMDDSRRYDLREFLSFLPPLEEPQRAQSSGTPRSRAKPRRSAAKAGQKPREGTYLPSDVDKVRQECRFVEHCFTDAETLGHDEWYAALSIVGRCEDGERHAHEMSRPYAGYSRDETQRELDRSPGPATCQKIQNDWTNGSYCQGCPHWGKVLSPIRLGEVEPVICLEDRTEDVNEEVSGKHQAEGWACPFCGTIGTLDDQLIVEKPGKWVYCCTSCKGERLSDSEPGPESEKGHKESGKQEQSQGQERRRQRVFTHAEARRFKYPLWSWEGIYRVGASNILFSPTSQGKTTLAAGLVVAKLFERPFLGRAVEPGSVFYWAAEDFVGVRERIDAYLLHEGLKWGDRKHELYYWQEGDNFRSPELRAYLLETMRGLKIPPNTFILDNLGCCFGAGNMIDQQEVTEYWDCVADFKRCLGWENLEFHTIHHSAAGSTRPFGSTISDNRIDAGQRLEKHENSNRVTLHCFKQRQGKEFAKIELMFVDVSGSEQGVLVPYVEDRSPMGLFWSWTELTIQEQDLIRVTYEDRRKWRRCDLLRKAELELKGKKAEGPLSRLVKARLLDTFSDNGRFYWLTEKGVELYEGRATPL